MGNVKQWLDEPWSVDGNWAKSPELSDGVPGVLEYDPEAGISLKFGGVLENRVEAGKSYPRLHGSVSGVGAATLVDAWTGNVTIGGPVRSTGGAYLAIFGASLPKARDVRFNQSAAALGNLEEWVGWRPIKPDLTDLTLSRFGYKYQRPDPLVARVPSLAATVQLISTMHTEADNWQSGKLVHTARFVVTADGQKQHDLPWHLETQGALRDLVTLLSGHPSWFRAFDLGKKPEDAFPLAGVRTAKPKKRIIGQFMALPFPALPVPFEDLMTRWFEHRRIYESAHHLLFGTIHEPMPYAEFGFLSAVQALEAYAKAPLSNTKAKDKKFMSCVQDLIDKFSPSMQRSLYSSSTKFPELVKYTRNYFTHYTRSEAKKAYQGVELHHAMQRIRLMLSLAFMLDLGIPESVLKTKVLGTMENRHALTWRGTKK